MNINKDILAFYWLRFVMWLYFIFHGMTTKYSKEVIIYHMILHWPVDIDRYKKLKWRPINPVSIEIWNRLCIYIYVDTGKSHVCKTSRTKNVTQAPMGAFQNSLKSMKLFTTWTSGIYHK
jgi:hypothetical protein